MTHTDRSGIRIDPTQHRYKQHLAEHMSFALALGYWWKVGGSEAPPGGGYNEKKRIFIASPVSQS
ncbi:hypothetical protein PCASD_12618 [Puccinia coronata f. sp. avenae]|uniref:Uncharacterized protein n=1 Tax=Puccinia coronata f. sp. avenae TaxID=200324 RepID=A0A2N5TEA6_9BASI|nr:hypothetical protein PCASD_12618 [Puccinia coronata f. sp. avenae]